MASIIVLACIIVYAVLFQNFLLILVKKQKIKGKLIIPNAVMAELENLANKGIEEGFLGLEDIAKLHHLKRQYKLSIYFEGLRPNETQIKYAKSGEIDALIREIAFKKRAVLVTADLVQAKSAQAYGIKILFMKPRFKKQFKKKFFLFGKSPFPLKNVRHKPRTK